MVAAASSSLFFEGQKDTAKAIKRLSQDKPVVRYSGDEALALILDGGLTKHSYQLLRNGAAQRNADLYPPYNVVRESKNRCYPGPETFIIRDYSAEVNFQNLMDHTAIRLCIAQNAVLGNVTTLQNISLRSKIGFDGATGQSVYKQVALNEPCETFTEESLFITCTVPIDFSGFQEENRTIIWRNPSASSTLYCRPVRFTFVKESTDVLKAEKAWIQEQLKNLSETRVELASGKILNIHHIVEITMIDGKVQTALSDITNSTQCCSICGVSPKKMNDIDNLIKNKDISEEGLKYGLSTLHSWIRFLECMLHLAYRQDIRKWQARGLQDQESVKSTKERIQKEFKQQIGLVVDKPRSGGSGTSNDGNTARRIFSNTDVSSKILGVDKQLMDMFSTVLSTLSSGFDINSISFQDYCIKTAKYFVELYPWFYMPQSVHKVLLHGFMVIERMSLPIGLMSEEAQEASNKNFKKFRENFTRKCSRIKTNTDLLNRLLCSSDPLISSLRQPQTRKNAKQFSSEVLMLLKPFDPELLH